MIATIMRKLGATSRYEPARGRYCRTMVRGSTSMWRWAPLSTSSCGIAASGIVAFAASFVMAADAGDSIGDTSTSCDAASAGVPSHTHRQATPSWISTSDKTTAECNMHWANTAQETGTSGAFDPGQSDYFEVKLIGRDDNEKTPVCPSVANQQTSQLLHNRIAILPNIMTNEECAGIAKETERILEENKAQNIQGRKTESWATYRRFNSESQEVIDKLLGQHVLEFLDRRMPEISKEILKGRSTCSDFKSFARKIGKKNRKNITSFCWDDPVVIKYDAGNRLAPHEDMRDLTIVVPLNPLLKGDSPLPLTGGGTRFWLEGTTPECATADDGVLLKPPAGWGIIFNGEITHSGESVEAGTRFVLMTSIVLDNESEEEEVQEDDDDDETE